MLLGQQIPVESTKWTGSVRTADWRSTGPCISVPCSVQGFRTATGTREAMQKGFLSGCLVTRT